MSRYIDADAFLKEYCEPYPHIYMAMSKAVADAQSIDIVRCKECRHWCNHKDADYDQSEFIYYCEVHGISLKGNEFCSYGERKEGE